jgi:alpha-L-rhamnosidase
MTFLKKTLIIPAVMLLANLAMSQDYYAPYRQAWLKKAEDSKPALIETVKEPVQLVNLVKDSSAFQGYRAVRAAGMDSLYQSSFKPMSGTVVDFGEHLTGYLTVTLKIINKSEDSPLRLKFTFGEVPAELTTPFDPFPGTLSRAWMQDEAVTSIFSDSAVITIPRRVAFRYLKIEVVASTPYCNFKIDNLQFKASTSVTIQPPPLAPGTDVMIAAIDKVGLSTLKECMQTVYEDGTKRDRRLWIGDTYLESLANDYSFKNHQLTKRCLYLLAGMAYDDGYLIPDVNESPKPHVNFGDHILDYMLLYNVALKNYLTASGDKQTALDLWPVAKRQLDIVQQYLGSDALMDNEKPNHWWIFFDWKDGLDKQACLQGLTIYVLKQTYELADLLGKQQEIAWVPAMIEKMTTSAHKNLFDKRTGLFVSGPQKQVSYGSQAWMVLAGVATKAEGQRALRTLPLIKDAVQPGAPYMYHYYIAALIECGLNAEAKAALIKYWGGMVKKGADTFWEVYNPANDYASPYNFFPLNSYCHAWSCTPVYFIRKYPEIFQR